MDPVVLDRLSDTAAKLLADYAAREEVSVEQAAHRLVEWAMRFQMEFLPTVPGPESFHLPPPRPKFSEENCEKVRESVREAEQLRRLITGDS